MATTIYFNSHTDPHGFLSNFAPYPIRLKGKMWPTTEHYFQAQKYAGTAYEEEIRQAPKPRIAAALGRDLTKPCNKDWDSVRDSVMLEALRAKFTQHAELAERLLETGDAVLVEHTKRDPYWADGGDGSGRNRLGQLLMQVREELRAGNRS